MGLLVEVHLQGHCKYLEERVLPALGVLPVLAELSLREEVGNDLATFLFDIACGKFSDRPRLWVPKTWSS